jgi:enoyl-CoA hydratase/carnithine racemase
MPGSPPSLGHPLPHVALVELHRPHAANRLQPEDLATLLGHLDVVDADRDVHSLVVASAGSHFCAGYDLRALVADLASGDEWARGENAFEAVAERLATIRPVTVAAIQGAVIGGATDLALACDLRIGSPAAQMQMPAARFGLPLYASALERYVTRLGIDHAKRLVLLAEKIDADEMLRIGFLHRLVPAEALRERALEIAADVASMPPGPLAAMKQVLNASAVGQGKAAAQREALAAAYDPRRIAATIGRIRNRRSGGD